MRDITLVFVSCGLVFAVTLLLAFMIPSPDDVNYLLTVDGVGEFHVNHLDLHGGELYFRDRETKKRYHIVGHSFVAKEE